MLPTIPARIRLKQLFARAFVQSGAPKRRARSDMPSCRILCYHCIGRSPTHYFSLANRLCVSPEAFRWQLKYLRREFNPLSEKEFVRRVSDGFGPRDVLVTLDDGTIDLLLEAAPLLSEHGIPAVAFVCGDPSARISWWFDLAVLIDREFASKAPRFRTRIFWSELRRWKELPRVDRESEWQVRATRCGARGEEWPELRVLNASEIGDLSAAGISVGAHGFAHEELFQLNSDRLESEIHRSVDAVSTATGESPKGFAYAYGKRRHLNASADRIVKALKLEYALTTQWGFNMGPCDRYRLERIVIDGTDDRNTFIAKLWGGIWT